MRTIRRLSWLLNDRRLAYARIAGALLWAGWLTSIALGPGKVDLAGQVVGTDYLEFYAAGTTLRLGESAHLYDVDYQSRLQGALIGPQLRHYYGFITPPFLAWLFVPLAGLPYLWSFALWSRLGLLGLWVSLRLLAVAGARRALLWSLTWFPVFATISYGQNSLLSLTLMSLVYRLWHRERPWAAGLVLALLLYKPQLVVGVALLWLLQACVRRRELAALAGLALGGGLLAGLCFWLLPEASRAYVEFARTVLPDLPDWQEFPLWNLHTVWGFWRLLLPQRHTWADALYWLFTAAGVLGFVSFWRRFRARPALLFAGAICLTLLITPHAMIYDWTLLLIPAVLLWQQAPELRGDWKALYALIWIATFVSGPLTHFQLRWLPFAVQISVPVFQLVVCLAYRSLEAFECRVAEQIPRYE